MRPPLQILAGSIPAHAGETIPVDGGWHLTTVHPRACGGNSVCTRKDASCRGPSRACGGNSFSARHSSSTNGPSPRMRGKRKRAGHRVDRRGSIPAHAGETSMETTGCSLRRVHPRACGGNLQVASPSSRHRGPSPRMRGKRTGCLIPPERVRSIPAHAGETPTYGIRIYWYPKSSARQLPSDDI